MRAKWPGPSQPGRKLCKARPRQVILESMSLSLARYRPPGFDTAGQWLARDTGILIHHGPEGWELLASAWLDSRRGLHQHPLQDFGQHERWLAERNRWLARHGLFYACFATRRAALEALQVAWQQEPLGPAESGGAHQQEVG